MKKSKNKKQKFVEFINDKVYLKIPIENAPDKISEDGTQMWYNDQGELHRDGDLPAIIKFDGSKSWYKDGKLHRDNDLPAIITSKGYKHWYLDGKLHRDNDLPAFISKHTYMWYVDGVQYRPSNVDYLKPITIYRETVGTAVALTYIDLYAKDDCGVPLHKNYIGIVNVNFEVGTFCRPRIYYKTKPSDTPFLSIGDECITQIDLDDVKEQYLIALRLFKKVQNNEEAEEEYKLLSDYVNKHVDDYLKKQIKLSYSKDVEEKVEEPSRPASVVEETIVEVCQVSNRKGSFIQHVLNYFK